MISSLVEAIAGLSLHDNVADLSTAKSPFENADIDVILQIFGWIHPSKVFKYRRLNRRINQLLLTNHFAVLNLQYLELTVTRKPAIYHQRNACLLSDMEIVFFFAPPSFQSVYASRALSNEDALEWEVDSKCRNKVPIPSAIWELSKLTRLQLLGGCFSIPPDIVKLVNLKHLDLNRGYYAGTIPAEIWQLGSLETLYLASCSLNGELSKDVAKLVNLKVLNLAGNRYLGGSIPCEIGTMSRLTDLNLSSCNFSGMIPREIGALLNLKTLDLSNNQVSGKVPPEICDLTNLELLSLNNNKLSGVFPQEFRNLTKIRRCNLEKNLELTYDLKELLAYLYRSR
ncbi:L domain-like protein [Rhizoclosmatium globosum]|uniref:L domain-like protein n=1 Tax=Rhizoclosmatium globosum TaxID=329046 RepID=A0A1Y2B5W4_9FUNG|nr:L domain-like protein [Rhizoclosmatium globosum]|eukprot:ORY30124.1 L domain-like protein [Rhizoclosmatium globosum]